MPETPEAPRKVTKPQWHAFVTTEDDAKISVLTAPSQKELKRQLNGHKGPIHVHGIVRGTSFSVREQRSFEFVGNDEVESLYAEEEETEQKAS